MRRGMSGKILVIGTLLLGAQDVDAQRAGGPGAFLGVSFVATDAIGELGSAIDEGFGLELTAAAPMSGNGHLRLRGDLGFVVYGFEQLQFCALGCRVSSELTTTNSIVYGGVGPEIVLARGPFRPYVHASAGLSYFVTSSSLDDHDGYGSYLETTNFSDVVFGWAVGGGFRMRVGNGHRPVFLDFGVERRDNGVATYLTEGDIVDHADGSVTMYPNRSEADLLNFRLGVSIGLGS